MLTIFSRSFSDFKVVSGILKSVSNSFISFMVLSDDSFTNTPSIPRNIPRTPPIARTSFLFGAIGFSGT